MFGHEYELYHVNNLHITYYYVRWVCDLPGAFCRFLWSEWLAIAFLKFSSKRRRLAGLRTISIRSMCGKGGTHLIPHRTGVKLMEANPRDYGEQCRFDAFCKKVLRNEARAYLRNMKRQREREAFFSDLSQAELDKLCVVDRYPSDSIVFSSHGYDLHIDNELVAEAFSALPQTEQSILILHCTLDLADGEIGNLVGMSRSAVQRHRTKALQELREALSALMPKGG